MAGNAYVLLWNLHTDREQILAPGITLRPLKQKINVIDLAAAGASGFREWAVLEPLADRCHCEIESAHDAAVAPAPDALGRAWLANCLFVLRGSGAFLSVAHSYYTWNQVAGSAERQRISGTKLPTFTGRLLEDYRVRFILCDVTNRHNVTAADVEWMRTYYERFEKLLIKSKKVAFALVASVDWRYAHDQRTAIARIWSGIESLLGISVEIVYRLSITSASLLKPRGPERIAYYDAIRKLYGIRSKAVHGDEIPEEKLNAGLNDSFILLRDLLIAAADRGSEFSEDDIKLAMMG